jgi:hypothetical protein
MMNDLCSILINKMSKIIIDQINDKSIWNDSAIEETIKRMDPDQLYRYQKMAQCMYDKANDPNPHTVKMEASTQVMLMLRDGLNPDMLEEDERQIFIETYGLKSLQEYSKEYSKDDDRNDNQRVNSDQDQAQGISNGDQRTKKGGSGISKRDPNLPQ